MLSAITAMSIADSVKIKYRYKIQRTGYQQGIRQIKFGKSILEV
jgi:hypothetical protein